MIAGTTLLNANEMDRNMLVGKMFDQQSIIKNKDMLKKIDYQNPDLKQIHNDVNSNNAVCSTTSSPTTEDDKIDENPGDPSTLLIKCTNRRRRLRNIYIGS